MDFVFSISLIIILYVYLGYPLLLLLLSSFRPKRVEKRVIEPTVTIIITAYNEELHIREKIENTLELDYPLEKLEIIVASDASTDKTDDIVRYFEDEGVKLLRNEPRRGKTAMQNTAATYAKGEIVVFSDATTYYEKNVLREIVQNFADQEVGCVGGLLQYRDEKGNVSGTGGGMYWRYETWVKKRESLMGSLIGVSGCLYAVRKSIYRPIPEDLISDFLIAFEVSRSGYRTVLEPKAISVESTEHRVEIEFKMRVRVALRTFLAIIRSSWALNIFRYPRLAWQLWSHKVFRYTIPLFLILIFICSIFGNGVIYRIFLTGQVLFYGVAAIGCLSRKSLGRYQFFNIPFYFCLVNTASFVAFVKMLRGEKYITWETVRS